MPNLVEVISKQNDLQDLMMFLSSPGYLYTSVPSVEYVMSNLLSQQNNQISTIEEPWLEGR